jgi:DNA-binding CsgD family transcriptional regulator
MREVYEQLLWRLSAVDVCPKHKIKLVNHCNCKGTSLLPPIKVTHLPGICASCGGSLAQEDISKLERASSEELKRTQVIAELIGNMETINNDTYGEAKGIALFLQGAVRRFADGKASHFAKMLGIRKNILHGWLHGNHIPSFPQLVNIALACDCSILHILQGKQNAMQESGPVELGMMTPVSSRRKAAQKLNLKKLGKKLQVLAVEEPPIKPIQAAARLGIDRRTLYTHFGQITRRMTLRFRSHIQQENKRRFEHKCNLYRRSAEKILRQGRRPTSASVAVDLKGIETVRPGEQRAACVRICREVIESFQSL